MGQLYKEMGFINTGHTVQATRADLVGQYIGHTGPKTKVLHDMIILILNAPFGIGYFLQRNFAGVFKTQS